MGSSESRPVPPASQEPVDDKTTIRLIKDFENPSVPSSSLPQNESLPSTSLSHIESQEPNLESNNPNLIPQPGKFRHLEIQRNELARSSLTREEKHSPKKDVSKDPIQTPLLLPKIERQQDSHNRCTIPRDPRQTGSLSPLSKIEQLALEEEIAKKLALASPRTDETLTRPILSSVIDIKTEPLDEDEIDDSSSNWMDPWLKNTDPNSDQTLPMGHLAKPAEDDSDSDGSVATVCLPSPTRCSPTPSNDIAESENNDTSIKASALYSPTVEFYEDDDNENLSEHTAFTTVEDFNNEGVDDIDHTGCDGPDSYINNSDEIVEDKGNSDEDHENSDEGEEETFAADMFPHINASKRIKDGQPCVIEEPGQNQKRPFEVPNSESDVSTVKKARFQIITNPNYNANIVLPTSSASLTNQNQIIASDSEATTNKEKVRTQPKVKLTTKNRSDRFLDDFMRPNPGPKRRTETQKTTFVRRNDRTPTPSSIHLETETGTFQSTESQLATLPVNRDPRLRSHAQTSSYPFPTESPETAMRNSVLQRVLKWSFNWIEEQKRMNDPPPILQRVNEKIPEMKCGPMMTTYPNLETYFQVLKPLMIHEMWSKLSQEYMKEYRDIPISWDVLVHSKKDQGDCLTLVRSTLIAKDPPQFPCKNDLVTFSTTRETRDFYFFGIVESCAGPEVTFRVWKNYFQKCQLNVNYRVEKVASVVSAMFQFDALAQLTTSSLIDRILNPHPSHFELIRFREREGNSYLNPQQMEAVNSISQAMLGIATDQPKICLLQGYPGTGKSHAIVYIVDRLMDQHPRHRILICAPTDSGVDELVRRLLQLRLRQEEGRFKILRIGKGKKTHPAVWEKTLEHQLRTRSKIKEETYLESDSQIQKLNQENNLLGLKKQSIQKKMDDPDSVTSLEHYQELLKEFQKIEARLELNSSALLEAKKKNVAMKDAKIKAVTRQIIDEADIICATLHGLCDPNLEEFFVKKISCAPKAHRPFSYFILDDASHCTEPETLMPLKFTINKFVLVGDLEQSPFSIKSPVSKTRGFGKSLFTRLCSNLKLDNDCPFLFNLDYQYRMHPQISDWPAKYFYGGELKTSNSASRPSPLHAYRLFDVTDGEESNEGYRDLVNHQEATFVTNLIEGLFARGDLNNQTMGIITFYDKHSLLLRKKIKERWPKLCDHIMVSTVEGFHGTEKDIIIISCVKSIERTNENDLAAMTEKLTVALTRARHSLFICGQLRYLLSNEIFKCAILDAEKRQVIHRVSSFLHPSIIDMLVSKI